MSQGWRFPGAAVRGVDDDSGAAATVQQLDCSVSTMYMATHEQCRPYSADGRQEGRATTAAVRATKCRGVRDDDVHTVRDLLEVGISGWTGPKEVGPEHREPLVASTAMRRLAQELRVAEDLRGPLVPIGVALVIAQDYELHPVRLIGQPSVEVNGMVQLAVLREVTGVNQDVAIWDLQAAVEAVSVADADDAHVQRAACLEMPTDR